jgi:hypothetical protein
LLLLAGGALVPSNYRGVDARLISAAGRGTPSVVEEGLGPRSQVRSIPQLVGDLTNSLGRGRAAAMRLTRVASQDSRDGRTRHACAFRNFVDRHRHEQRLDQKNRRNYRRSRKAVEHRPHRQKPPIAPDSNYIRRAASGLR